MSVKKVYVYNSVYQDIMDSDIFIEDLDYKLYFSSTGNKKRFEKYFDEITDKARYQLRGYRFDEESILLLGMATTYNRVEKNGCRIYKNVNGVWRRIECQNGLEMVISLPLSIELG